MDLPVMPPVAPMLAELTRELPEGEFLYEPKWDGSWFDNRGPCAVDATRLTRPLKRIHAG